MAHQIDAPPATENDCMGTARCSAGWVFARNLVGLLIVQLHHFSSQLHGAGRHWSSPFGCEEARCFCAGMTVLHTLGAAMLRNYEARHAVRVARLGNSCRLLLQCRRPVPSCRTVGRPQHGMHAVCGEWHHHWRRPVDGTLDRHAGRHKWNNTGMAVHDELHHCLTQPVFQLQPVRCASASCHSTAAREQEQLGRKAVHQAARRDAARAALAMQAKG
jgi:hypothetical protein